MQLYGTLDSCGTLAMWQIGNKDNRSYMYAVCNKKENL